VTRLLALVAITFAACFNPTFNEPACGPNGECPSGSTCEQSVCRENIVDVDGAIDSAIDSSIDSPIDAPSDGTNDGAPNDGVVQCATGDMQSPTDPSRCFRKLATAQPWNIARNSCTMIGGDLADVRTGQENQVLGNLAGGEAGQGIWLAGTDQMIEMEWRWVNTNVLVNNGPIFWASGEPNGGGIDDCMRIDQLAGWYDTDCNLARKAACVVPPL
jgi:hypothetical protein